MNEYISKKSGIAVVVIGLLWEQSGSDPDNAVWYSLGMVAIGLAYMTFDFFKKIRG